MRVGAGLLILLVVGINPDVASATELAGKWGLGVSVGSIFSSNAEASLIRGKSARTAWIADFVVSISSDHRTSETDYKFPAYPDTTIVTGELYDLTAIEVGPRLRTFTSPANSFSAYGDVYLHFLNSTRHQSYNDYASSETRVGGKVGFSIGVEYFSSRWPFSVGAHTDVATFSALHASGKLNDPSRAYTSTGTNLFASMALRPTLQLRVYF